ncbi:MAG: hypothetical protein RI953_1874 [Pseudomonadota bacterium]
MAKNYRVFFLLLITSLAGLISCSKGAEKNGSLSTREPNFSVQSGGTSQVPGFGQIRFNLDSAKWSTFSARSAEQPDVKIETLSDGKFALKNLLPGRHTLFVEAESNQEKAVAAIANIIVEGGTAFDVGNIALQKPAQISGRVVAIRDGSVVQNATLKIPTLGISVVSGGNGEFSFTSVPAGTWHLNVRSTVAGMANNIPFTTEAGKTNDLGDVWIGEWDLEYNSPTLLNAPHGIVTEKILKMEAKFPTAARSFKVVDILGNELVARRSIKKNIDIPLLNSGINDLRLLAYDAGLKLIGEFGFSVLYDPFSDGTSPYVPSASVAQRSIVSPNRTFSISLNNLPSKATEMKIAFESAPSTAMWMPIQSTYELTLGKSNSNCGRQDISVQYRTADALESREFVIPVTLSCWQRIPQRALLERIVGIQNVATWTGEYAFVWSGKLAKNAGIGSRGSYTQDTVEMLKKIQDYSYLDGGYIYNPVSRDMEFIVTDFSPTPRANAGVSGRRITTVTPSRNLVAVFGGENNGTPIADGGIYDISTNAWISMQGEGAPSPRIKPSVHFISDTEVLVWGGLARTDLGYEFALGDGAIYNMTTHQWRKMSEVQAPSPRYGHVGIWSGGNTPEFVVLGGARPGDVFLDSGARYSPATDTWLPTPSLTIPASGSTPEKRGEFAFAGSVHTRLDNQLNQKGKIIVFGGKAGRGEFLRKGFVFDLDSNSVSQQRIGLAPISGVADLYLNPTVFVDGDGSSTKHHFFVVAGSASEISSDIEPRILIAQYHDGQVKTDDGTNYTYTSLDKTFLSPWLSWYTSGGKPIYTCCEDWLAFNDNNGKTFVMNGTVTHDSSVYTTVQTSTLASGRTINATTQVPQSKLFQSFNITYDAGTNNFTFGRIDGQPNNATSNRPNGPNGIFDVNEPVWDTISKQLIFYGARSTDTINAKDALSGWYTAGATQNLGGWLYNTASKTWNQLPMETGSLVSRFSAPNFLLNGKFFQLGGYRAEGSPAAYVYKFDGIMIDHRSNPTATPTALLNTSTAIDFDYSPLSDWTKSSFNGASTCQNTDGTKLMFVGGKRLSTRTVTDVDATTAHTQKQVILDSTTTPPSLSYASATDSPGVRHLPTVVSTNMGCFVWGGYSAPGTTLSNTVEEIADASAPLANGALFDFSSGNWSPSASTGAPSARLAAHGVWTGSEVLVWGGLTAPRMNLDSDVVAPKGVSLYNPTTNQWRSLPATAEEPRFRATERPVWTGRHMFLWKSRNQDYTWYFTHGENKWGRIPQPAGFSQSSIVYTDAHVRWLDDRLLVMPSSYASQVSVMAFFIPPDP